MKTKNKKASEGTFKMRNGGVVIEVPNSHRKAIEKLMASGGDVDAYLHKALGGVELTQQAPPAYNWNTGFGEFENARYDFYEAQSRKNYLASMQKPADMTDEQWSRYQKNERRSIAGRNTEGAGHLLLGLADTTKNVLGAMGADKQRRLGFMNEQQSFNLHNRERAEITNPYDLYGDQSELGNGRMDPLMSKYGNHIPMAALGSPTIGPIHGPSHEDGGVAMDFSNPSMEINDLKSPRKNAQVEAQGGETAIQHAEGGYIFSKEKNMASTKKEYIDKLSKLNDGGYSLGLFQEKFKNKSDDAMITPAEATKPFETESDKRRQLKLAKKLGKSEEIVTSPVSTKISQVTAELNNSLTYKPEIQALDEAIHMKTIAPLAVIAPMNDAKRTSNLATAADGKRLTKRQRMNQFLDAQYQNSRDLDSIITANGALPIQTGSTSLGNIPITPVNNSAVTPTQGTPGYYPWNPQFENIGPWGTPRYSNTGFQNLPKKDLESILPQFEEVRKHDPELASSLFEGLQLGHLAPNTVTKPTVVAGQHKNKSDLYGTASRESVNKLQAEFPAMAAIAQKYGKSEFDPTDQKMLDDFERSYNATYREETGKDFFLPGTAKHAFDVDKKTGNWHISIPHIIRRSNSPVEQPDINSIYDKQNDVFDFATYQGTGAPAKPAKKKAGPDYNPKVTVPLKDRRGYYYDPLNPLQLVGETATLFDRYEPAPYVEDQGAKDAYAMATKPRYLDIQPQLNRISRGLKSATRYSQSPSVNAQLASNAYEAANQVYNQKYNADSQIDAAFNRQLQELKVRAGTNKASALDLLAQRTAKGHSAYNDRAINAMSLIGNKFMQNKAENRASMLYQDMFPNFSYDGYSTNWDNSANASLYAGSKPYAASTEQAKAAKLKAQADLLRKQAEDLEKGLPSKKCGGKVKLPKKRVK